MSNFIVFLIFIIILYIALSGAIGLYFATEKGINKVSGFIIGILIPLIGHIYLATLPISDEIALKEVYDRELISMSDYKTIEKTIETKVKK